MTGDREGTEAGTAWSRTWNALAAAEGEELALAAEAALALGLSAVALRLFSLRTLTRLSGRLALSAGETELEGRRPARTSRPERLAWAIDAVSKRLGGHCLCRSLALQWLLARRGIPADLCVGVRTGGPLVPLHAWVDVDGQQLGSDGRPSLQNSSPPRFEILARLPEPGSPDHQRPSSRRPSTSDPASS